MQGRMGRHRHVRGLADEDWEEVSEVVKREACDQLERRKQTRAVNKIDKALLTFPSGAELGCCRTGSVEVRTRKKKERYTG